MKTFNLIRLKTLIFFVIIFSFIACSFPINWGSYTPKLPNGDLEVVKAQMSKLFNDNLRTNVVVNNLDTKISFVAKEIFVLDDKIEFIRKDQKMVLNSPHLHSEQNKMK